MRGGRDEVVVVEAAQRLEHDALHSAQRRKLLPGVPGGQHRRVQLSAVNRPR